ncbi:hypothetical protein BDF21DRAFT_428978 [Thamnidium elegans]|nr:hypothetical protein BDF21DRAFT_428978 [Thamnidium elegans]
MCNIILKTKMSNKQGILIIKKMFIINSQCETGFSFCPSCGVDVSIFSHESHCPLS